MLPTRGKPGDAGLDLYCIHDGSVDFYDVESKGILKVRTGLAVEIPVGYVGLIKERSSTPSKYGLTACSGVIDSGYRGEIVMCFNVTKECSWGTGDRLAQLLIIPVYQCQPEFIEHMTTTDRGTDGFGSTGS